MKLYYAPGTCALSPHIVLNELGLPYRLVRVDNKAKKTADGRDYLEVNPKGYVPALELDDGQVLTEGPVIAQYLADLRPDAQLAPPQGTFERVRLQEWLFFISTEVHKTFSPLFNPALPAAAKALFVDKLAQRFAFIDQRLHGRDFLLGGRFTIGDAYLYTVARWAPKFDLDFARWPSLARFMERVGARASVRAALDAESGEKKAA